MKSLFTEFADPDSHIHREWIDCVADALRVGGDRPDITSISDPILYRLVQIAQIKADSAKLLECN